MQNDKIIENLSSRARVLQGSKIREVAEFGMKQGDVLPLWFGEGAWPTSSFIVDAAVASLKAGNVDSDEFVRRGSLRQAWFHCSGYEPSGNWREAVNPDTVLMCRRSCRYSGAALV